jgi:hypothetical protein
MVGCDQRINQHIELAREAVLQTTGEVFGQFRAEFPRNSSVFSKRRSARSRQSSRRSRSDSRRLPGSCQWRRFGARRV